MSEKPRMVSLLTIFYFCDLNGANDVYSGHELYGDGSQGN